MNTTNLRIAKNICWILAAVAMFFLILGNDKNNYLSATALLFILGGMGFSFWQDKKHQ